MRGSVTPEETIAAFRAHYLYSGNASESARDAGIDERTGRDIARKLIDDPDFTEARRFLRATALEELVAARMRVMKTALERFEEDLDVPIIPEGNRAPITVVDKRGEYGKIVLDAEKNAHSLARFDAELSGKITQHVVASIKDATPAKAREVMRGLFGTVTPDESVADPDIKGGAGAGSGGV